MQREVFAGVALGTILATIGMIRLAVWQSLFHTYGEHRHLVAITVAVSLVGVVLWGTVSGSMLPFVIRGWAPTRERFGAVHRYAVDVSGLVIYFEVARTVLGGPCCDGAARWCNVPSVRTFSGEALILDVFDLQEKDRIVTLLTRERGKKKGVAPGARRKYSRFAGQLQPLAKVRCAGSRRRAATWCASARSS